MTAPVYRCPLTARTYPAGTKITFHINGERGRDKTGVLMQGAEGEWKVLSKAGILPIATTGRAVAPQSIRRT